MLNAAPAAGFTTRTLRFTRRDWLIGLLIVALAFALRLVIITDRAASPVTGAFDPLPTGSDQTVYYGSIADYQHGLFPPPTYFFQPGMSWLLIGISGIMRTDNVGALRIFIAWLAALNCGLFVATVRLASGRRSVAYLAGFLLAIYPVGAFFDTDFVITSQAVELVNVLLFGTCWLWRAPRSATGRTTIGSWVGAALIGLSVGLLMLFRGELVMLFPIIALFLLFTLRQRLVILQIGLAALLIGLVILPTVLHNRAGGASYLITPEGTAAIYYANNRDADGTATLPVASQYVGGDYLHSLWNDFWLSPLRFAELELHKVGLYLSKNEPGNDLSYPLSGAAVSPLLRADPFNFSILVMLACFAGWAAWCGVGVRDPEARRSGRQAAGLFALVALTMAATTLLIWVEGRIRTAAIVALIPLGAQGIVAAGSAMQAAWRGWRLGRNVPQWRDLARAAIAIIGIALLMLAGQFAEDHLPLPVTASDLPASAQPLHALFDNNLELLGWQVQDQYSAQGVIRPFVPYVIAVYWRLRQPTSIDYSFAFGFYLNGDRLLGYDHPVGTVSFPARPTSTWPAGQIRVEYLATTWRQFTGPFEQSGDLFLSVYPNRDALHLLPAANLPDQPDHIRLARPAIMIGSGALPADWPHDQPPVTFSGANGDALSLISWRAPGGSAVIAGQPLTFDFGWQSGDQPIRASYTFGIYALDASQQVAVQTDSLLHQGALLSSSLPPHYRLPDTMTLKAPGTAGTYTLALVIYDSLTHERLQAPGLVNGLFTLGTITVQ